MLTSMRRWIPRGRAFSTAPAAATQTTVLLAHLAPLPASLPDSGYTVTPPVQPWPRRLTARSLSHLILRSATPHDAVLALRHALLHANPQLPPSLPVFAAALTRLAAAAHTDVDAAARFLPAVLSALRAARLPTFSDRPFLPLLRALPPLPSLKLFLSLPSFNSRPSVRSFNALLHSLVSARRLRLAAALFRAARSKLYITPNLVSCNILLKGLAGIGGLDAALKVLDEMTGWGIVPDVVTYTTILSAYCGKGDHQGAQKLFDDIIASGRRPDATMYTVLIDGYCMRGKLQDAARIMDEMEAAGVHPNEVTFSVVIEACCKEGKSIEAHDLMQEMLGAGYVPDTPLCVKVVDVLCQDGKTGEAYEMWRWMVKKSVPPD
jgi:pentatricopeptide repeat protein